MKRESYVKCYPIHSKKSPSFYNEDVSKEKENQSNHRSHDLQSLPNSTQKIRAFLCFCSPNLKVFWFLIFGERFSLFSSSSGSNSSLCRRRQFFLQKLKLPPQFFGGFLVLFLNLQHKKFPFIFRLYRIRNGRGWIWSGVCPHFWGYR